MLKKYYLVLLLLFYSFNVYADVFGAIGECLSNPCNCGAGQITETWGSGDNMVTRTVDPNPNCPPWNKDDGRYLPKTDRDGNCLVQFDYPGKFAYVFNYCAEHTTDSTYFSPKIRVRSQACLPIAACWTQSATLNWDGECTIIAGPFGLPLARICARIAVPAVPSSTLNPSGTAADPGYMVGQHIDDVGFVRADGSDYPLNDDIPIPAGTGNQIARPKLCAYGDPGLVNLVSDTGVHTDALDWNALSQPLHKTTELSPIARILTFLLQFNNNMSWPSMISNLLDMIGSQTSIPGLDVIQKILKAIGDIVNFAPKLMIAAIKEFGSLNSAVDNGPDKYNGSLGCVELPIGPYPPPYCNPLRKPAAVATTQRICSAQYTAGSAQKNLDGSNKTNPDGSIKTYPAGVFKQSSTASCVVSKLINNIVTNSIRVGFNNLVPLCQGTVDTSTTDKCAIIRNIVSSATTMHTLTTQLDTMKRCKKADDTFCIEYDTNNQFACQNNGCPDEFRIVYGQLMGSQLTPSYYYVDDINDCPDNSSVTCQQIWGINTGNFIDVSLQFPPVQSQDPNDLVALTVDNINIVDSNQTTRNFVAKIVRTPTNYTLYGGKYNAQNPQAICVYEYSSTSPSDSSTSSSSTSTTSSATSTSNTFSLNGSLVGCQPRVSDGYQILANDCGYDGIACANNSYYTPKFIATIQASNGDETSTIVEPLSISNPLPDKTQTERVVNLAGYDFGSFVAYIPPPPSTTSPPPSPPNDVYTAIPFSGARSLNPLTIYGQYKNNQVPYDKSGNPTGAQYQTGLEYINGQYIRGGTNACLQPKSLNHCVPVMDETNCVLAKLLETNVVDCSKFTTTTMTQYPNLRICSTFDTGCTNSGSLGGITIMTCGTAPNSYYCYQNTVDSGQAVCQVSLNYSDRIDPSPNLGAVISGDTQFYSVKAHTNSDGSVTFNQSQQALRDKTAQELNLCNQIPQILCDAVTTPTSDSGYATWTGTPLGTQSSGTCPSGWSQIDPSTPLVRYCLASSPPGVGVSNVTGVFEPLDSGVGCKQDVIAITYTTSPNFSAYPNNISSNASTKTGTIQVGNTNPLYWSPSGGRDQYWFQLDFNIADKTQIQSFKLQSIGYDDYVVVTVNGKQVYWGSGNQGSISASTYNSLNTYSDTNRFANDYSANKDLTPNLQNNANTIRVDFIIVGGGALYCNFQYKMN